MKILIDARESGTSTGRYVDKLVEYLQKEKPNHSIIILTKQGREEFFKRIAPGFSVQTTFYKEFTFGEQVGLLNQIKGARPDLVHFGMTQQPVFYKGLKVTTIHDLTTAKFDNPGKNRVVFKFKQEVYKWLIKKVARDSRFVITPSVFVKKDLAQFSGISEEKIFVTYEAAEKIPDSPQPVNELVGEKFLMYVGRPNPHKNLAKLIDAFEIVKSKSPNLKLVIAGKKDFLMRKHEQTAQKRGLASSIIFTGFVSEGQLRWLYENTAIYVFPSLSEGFGLPGLEAMVHGTPVVCSNATCLPEVYKNGAHYFDPNDTKSIVNAVNEVLQNQSLRETLIRNGKKVAAGYSWRRLAKQTLDVYEQALKL